MTRESIGNKPAKSKKEEIAEPKTTKPQAPALKPPDIKADNLADRLKSIAPTPEIEPNIGLKTKPKNLKKLLAEQKKEKKRKKEEERKRKEKAAKKKANLEKQKKRRLAESLEKLKKTVADQDKAKQEEASGQGSRGKGSGNTGISPLKRYQKELALIIQENWVFNDILAGIDRNAKVLIHIKILKTGEIERISYESRSGNQYLDDSAKKAIIKANPLPPLPYGVDSYEVGFIFTPRGVL